MLPCLLAWFSTVDGSQILLLRRLLLRIIRILSHVRLKERLKNIIAHSLQNRVIFGVRQCMQEGFQERCQVRQTDLGIHLVKLRHKNIHNL